MAGLAVTGAVLLIRRKRLRKARRQIAAAPEVVVKIEPKPVEPELPQDENYGRRELEASSNHVAELHGDRAPLPNDGRR